MSTPNPSTASMCSSCKKRPATTMYTDHRGNGSEQVCPPCLDRLEIVEAFERGLLETYTLYKDEEDEVYFEKTLAWLDDVERKHRHRDHDGWLARTLASHRALVYWQAERYEESLTACELRDSLGYDKVWDRWPGANAKAGALEGLGRHAEALTVFEEAFRHQDPRLLAGARYYLPALVKYSTNAGQPVDESWRALAQRIAEHYHVEFPVRPTLAESMLALYEMTKTDAERMAPEDEDEDD